jgi:HlyD family secretion protein
MMVVSVSTATGTELIAPKLKKSKRKWIFGGIAVVVVLGIGIPTVLAQMQTSNTVSPADIYKVAYGPVVQYIGTSGAVEIPNQVNLQFQSGSQSANGPSGQLTSLPIAVGQVVKAGQVLATVNPASAKLQVIQAESSVAQSQGNLASAQAALTKDLQGTTQSQITQDQISVQKAQQTLAAAKLQYQGQLAVYNDRTAAKQQVIDAENTLKMAQQQAQNTVSNQQSIQSAQQKITSDQSTIAAAQLTLKTDQQTLANDQQTLATDQQTQAQDQAQYGTVTSAQVQKAYQQYQSEEQLSINWQNDSFSGSNPYNTPASNAQANYTLLNNEYTALQADQTKVTNDQNTVTKDQNTVAKDQTTITADQSQLAADQAALTNAQSSSTYSNQQTQLQIKQDEQAVQAALLTYNDRTSAQQTLVSAKITIAQDQIGLKSAEATLQADLQPTDATTIQAAQASVSNAQAALKSAEAQLQSAQLTEQETVLRAPIDGIITALDVANGSPISGTTVVATMEANTKSESLVQLTVSESQVESVKVGEPMTLTVDALPNVTFNGRIMQVYPVPTTTSNVTNYTVIANVDNSSGDLKPGMSVNVEIQVANKPHVLTVPAISLVQLGSIEGVYVIGNRSTTGAGSAASGFAHKHHGTQTGSGTGGFSGSSSGASNGGFSSASSSSGGLSGSSSGASASSLPKGVYFQPVQIGLFGTTNVEVTQGLSAGESIMLIPPGSAAQSGSSNGPSGTGMAFRAARGGGKG